MDECDGEDTAVPGAAVFSTLIAPVMQLPRQDYADALDDAAAEAAAEDEAAAEEEAAAARDYVQQVCSRDTP